MPDSTVPLYGHNLIDDGREGIVGSPVDRADGPLKVAGAAPYAYEYAKAGDVAYGYVLGSTIARGRIARIDTTAAEAAPGVLLVLTHRNTPKMAPEKGMPMGGPRPVLQGDAIRFRGEPVAFVVAVTFETARRAAALVSIDYEAEPIHADLDAGLDDLEKPASLVGDRPTDTAMGDFDAAFAAAPVRLDETWRTPFQHHVSMEPQATMAAWDGDRLTVHTSTQSSNNVRDALAATLIIPKDKVRLLTPYVGGGFGAKLQVHAEAPLAAVAAQILRRPVKTTLTRQQTFTASHHRPATIQRVRLGAGRDGRLTAIAHDSINPYGAGRMFIESSAAFTRNLYAGANRLTSHRAVRLDLPAGGAMRAPGEATGMMALEAAMDELAHALGIDPIALRIRNEPEVEPQSGRPFSTRGLIDCMQEGARLFGWDQRPKVPASRREGNLLIGYGMSAAIRSNMLTEAHARVLARPDGRVVVQSSATDIGTGSFTILAQVAAEAMGLPLDLVSAEIGDTDLPVAMGSGGSIAANANGSAVLDACLNLRAALAQAAGANDPGQLDIHKGQVRVGGGPAEPFGDFIARVAPQGLQADGKVVPDPERQKWAQHSFGAFFCEVGVDVDTGQTGVRRMLGVFACGRILNPKTTRSQLMGGMTWGIGSALNEETVVDPRYGAFINGDLAGYHIASHADAANIDAVLLPELDDKANPLKSKGVGEVGVCGAAASVANAVFNATGVRVRDYPITLDKLLGGLPQI